MKHLLKDCLDCPPDERKTLFDNLRKDWSDRKKGASQTKGAENNRNKESLVLLTDTLGGFFKETICADNGAIANIMGKQTLDRNAAAGGESEMENKSKPRVFNMVVHDNTRAK